MALNVVLIGPPGAGKGTQAERLAARLNVPRISTGDLLREAVALGTPLGVLVRAVMARGELVSDDLMVGLVRERLERQDAAAGFVLDGFPRTVPQAEALEGLVAGRGPLAVVEILVPEDELVRRLGARLVCRACGVNALPGADGRGRCRRCGGELMQRADDDAEVVRERLRVFARATRPLVEFYRSRSVHREVSGTGTPDEVFGELTRTVAEAAR
jgi:adenylate kinase